MNESMSQIFNCIILCFLSENVNRPKDFDAMKKEEMLMDRRVSSVLVFLCLFCIELYNKLILKKLFNFMQDSFKIEFIKDFVKRN